MISHKDIESRIWKEITTTGARPAPRYGHKAVCYNNKMVIFGGHAATTYLNDLLLLDLGMHYVLCHFKKKINFK